MSASAARTIFYSANPREIGAKQKAESVAAKARENTASMRLKHNFLGGNRENLRVEEFR